MNWLLAVLVVGATWRLTRLLTGDYITKPVRNWVKRRYGDNRASYFVTCDWCASFWIGIGPTTLAVLWPTNRLVWAVLLTLTASLVTGLGASHLE